MNRPFLFCAHFSVFSQPALFQRFFFMSLYFLMPTLISHVMRFTASCPSLHSHPICGGFGQAPTLFKELDSHIPRSKSLQLQKSWDWPITWDMYGHGMGRCSQVTYQPVCIHFCSANTVAAWNLRCDYQIVKVRFIYHIAPACSIMFCCGLVWLFVAMMTCYLQSGPKLDRT